MTKQRSHYVTTSDGVTIGATVHGDGPPLVFLQGVIGDGDIDWGSTVGHLTHRFTCHLPSLRGRGLSDDHPDLSTPRLVEDCLTYVESLGHPAGLVGWSGGGTWALAVAAQSDAVAAVAPFEPGMLSLADEREQAVIATPSLVRASWPPKGTSPPRLAPSLAFPSTTKRSPWPRSLATSRPQGATSRTC